MPATPRPARRLTTRRLMAATAVAAVACTGLRAGPQPGWHLAAPAGHRVGACRNDAAGRTLDGHGRAMGHQWQAGVWRDGDGGWLVGGVIVRDGRVLVVVGDGRVLLF